MNGHAAITFHRTTRLLSAAYAARPEGVPVLWALLGHLGPFGAWPSVNRLCGILRRPVAASPGVEAIPPRPISRDTVERSLSAYVGAGILVERKRGGLRSKVYTLAEPWAAQLEGREAPTESQALKAAPERKSCRTGAAPSTELPDHEQIPPTPSQQTIDVPCAMAGGETPPAAPPVPPGRDRAGASPPPPPPDPAPPYRVGQAPRVADAAAVDRLLAWYGAAWFRRHGRAYLRDRRTDPRRIRTLLGWAAEAGASDPERWVREYLRRFLALGGAAADAGHVLGEATRSREACRPDARRSSCSPPAAPTKSGEPVTPEIRARLRELAGRRAAGGR